MTAVVVTESRQTVEVADGPTVVVPQASVEVVTVGIQGPEGSSAASYTHTQAAPSATWTINHNLGFRPAVELLSLGGAEMEGDVVHVSDNQCVVYFVIAVAGSARLQ